jgi:two-component system sensor histidine kinase BaeS
VQGRLLWKLVGIHMPVIGVVILVMWLAINHLAADYFMVLMRKYNISPTDAHEMFLEAVHRYLLWASASALAAAVVLSFFFTRRILHPLVHMTEVTRQIAAGEYTARVPLAATDEVGQLALAFSLCGKESLPNL